MTEPKQPLTDLTHLEKNVLKIGNRDLVMKTCVPLLIGSWSK